MSIYSGNLLKINGNTIDCIVSYTLQRNKLWGADSGRNLAGSMKGTLVGIFPKIKLKIKPKSSEGMATLENILDLASFEVEYYSRKYGCVCRGDFYAGDYDEDLINKSLMTYKAFTVSLIPNESEAEHVHSN